MVFMDTIASILKKKKSKTFVAHNNCNQLDCEYECLKFLFFSFSIQNVHGTFCYEYSIDGYI